MGWGKRTENEFRTTEVLGLVDSCSRMMITIVVLVLLALGYGHGH